MKITKSMVKDLVWWVLAGLVWYLSIYSAHLLWRVIKL